MLGSFIFVPVYSILNLLVYFSQIAVIPQLITLMNNTPQLSAVYKVILGQFVQGWPASAVSVLNQLAYAILGIPSIIFGIFLIKHKKISSLGGWLLVRNGLSCIFSIIGTVTRSQTLASGSVVGGALFLFSLTSFTIMIPLKEKRKIKLG